MSEQPSKPIPTRRREWVFWLLFWLAIACVTTIAIDYTKTFSDCMHEHKNDKDYQKLHERIGVFPSTTQRMSARARLVYACAGDFTDTNNGAIVAFATVMVSFFTFTLWRSTDRLWQASILHARHMEHSVKIAERSLTEVERALVIPLKVDSDFLLRGTQVLGHRITMMFTNTGRTPAKNTTSSARFVTFPGEVPKDFRFPDAQPPESGKGRILGQNVLFPVSINVAIQDILDIANNKSVGLFYGWIEYNDIFSVSRRRRTEFCVRMNVLGNPFIVPPPPTNQSSQSVIFEFGGYGEYNGTDEDCYYQPGQVPLADPGELPEPAQAPPAQNTLL
jgi:hypothetical protein